MSDESKHPKPQRNVFNLSWETEGEAEEAGHENEQEGSEEDFEGHSSGFNRPESV